MNIKLILFLLIQYVSCCLGDMIGTPAGTLQNFAHPIVNYYNRYGKLPTTFEEMDEYVDVESMKRSLGPLSKRFYLFTDSPIVPESRREWRKLVAISSNQISEDRHETLGRYALWFVIYPWNGKAGCEGEWMPESKAESVFKAAGRILPNEGVWKQPDVKGLSIHSPDEPLTGEQKKLADQMREEDLAKMHADQMKGYEYLIPKTIAPAPEKTIAQAPKQEWSKWLWTLILPLSAFGIWSYIKHRESKKKGKTLRNQ